MNKKILTIALALLLVNSLKAQIEDTKAYRNFPIVVSLQFHSLTMPFRDLKTNFTNIGLSLGTELSLNGKHNWAQQFNTVWFHNRATGNGLMFYTQTAWRPTIVSPVFTEIKAGAGYLQAFRPVESYHQINGEWVSAGHKGKGMLTIPVGVTVGYHKHNTQTYISPFVSYQFLMVSNYNPSVPLVPETLLQVGSRIHLKY